MRVSVYSYCFHICDVSFSGYFLMFSFIPDFYPCNYDVLSFSSFFLFSFSLPSVLPSFLSLLPPSFLFFSLSFLFFPSFISLSLFFFASFAFGFVNVFSSVGEYLCSDLEEFLVTIFFQKKILFLPQFITPLLLGLQLHTLDCVSILSQKSYVFIFSSLFLLCILS